MEPGLEERFDIYNEFFEVEELGDRVRLYGENPGTFAGKEYAEGAYRLINRLLEQGKRVEVEAQDSETFRSLYAAGEAIRKERALEHLAPRAGSLQEFLHSLLNGEQDVRIVQKDYNSYAIEEKT